LVKQKRRVSRFLIELSTVKKQVFFESLIHSDFFCSKISQYRLKREVFFCVDPGSGLVYNWGIKSKSGERRGIPSGHQKANFMFIGEYQHNLDDKGRLAIPAKFRSVFKKGAVVTKGLDNCLVLYSAEQFSVIAKKFAALPLSQARARAFSRHMLAGAMDVEFDVQGRITLPEYLRQFASVKKNVIIAGLYNHLEIWDEGAWQKYKADADKHSNEIAEQLGDLGI